ncbi:MAG TPA: hypothetical protein VN690_09110 [Terriglobales bacterium]|nr:hypothetical protein [Terriglobales bacterium]
MSLPRILLVLAWAAAILAGQQASGAMNMAAAAMTPQAISHAGSGTSLEPAAVREPMLMTTRWGWDFMVHGEGFLSLQEQSGPRGADKLFSTNWSMLMAQRPWGAGELSLRSMLSLEPATITKREFPELFQTGETAFGQAIVDGQHPHNFLMELAALYDVPVGERGRFSIYAAPMGDPALGPMAYPHRASASEDPLAPLGHHLEDSTHIAANVITLGASYGWVRVEGSTFHGREPGEHRWALQTGRPDSYSARFTLSPSKYWSGQISWGHIRSPEAQNPLQDQIRWTSSVMYSRGGWDTTLLWGRTRVVGGRNVLNGYLAEAKYGWDRNQAWTRIENVDRSNDLLHAPGPEQFLGRVQALSLGYDRQVAEAPWGTVALGGQWTLYRAPATLAATYGGHPQGGVVFLRAGLGRR